MIDETTTNFKIYCLNFPISINYYLLNYALIHQGEQLLKNFSSTIITFTSCSSIAHYVGLELIVLDDTRVIGVDDLKEWVDELALDGDP